MSKRTTLTKQSLMSLGITDVTKEGKIFKGTKELPWYQIRREHPFGKTMSYPYVSIYQHNTQKLLAVGRVVYAWFNNEAPGDKDVDHIDDNPQNNHLDNLQLLTRKENLAKRKAVNHVNKYTMKKKDNYDEWLKQKEQAAIRRDELETKRQFKMKALQARSEMEAIYVEKADLAQDFRINMEFADDKEKTRLVKEFLLKSNELDLRLKKAKSEWHENNKIVNKLGGK